MMIREVPYDSPEYGQTKKLRNEVLRIPIGLELSEKDTLGEDQQIHIAAIENDEVYGTVLLKPLTPELIKLRQMAVSSRKQGGGWGRSLVLYAEEVARSRKFRMIECNARVTAQVFYEKLGYHVEGERFTEVGLQTIKMTKPL